MSEAIFLWGFLILAGLVGLVAAFFDSKANQEENEIIQNKENENTVTYLRKTEYFKDEDITKYNWLDFSIKEISFPEEPVRYYAVVTVTGHNLGTSYANVIIRKDGDSYDFNPHWESSKFSDDWYPCMDTYDEVVEGLEVYFQAKKRHEDPNRHAALKKNYYYFDSKEEAAEAICAMKKKIDGFYRDKELSTKQITENEIKITFEK